MYSDTGKPLEYAASQPVTHTSDELMLRTGYSKPIARSTARYSNAQYKDTSNQYSHSAPHQYTPETTDAILANVRSIRADSSLPFKDTLAPIASRLDKLGVHSYKIVRTLQALDTDKDQDTATIHVERVYEWRARYLGTGFRIRSQQPYGSIVPSLSTYPVVECFNDDQCDLVTKGTVADVQSAFASGQLHPFMQSVLGRQDLYAVGNQLTRQSSA
jgi:hypothetical protein